MKYKVVSVPIELYRKLLMLKEKKESFAEVIARYLKKETPELRKFFGAWKMTDKEEKKMWRILKKMWSRKYEVSRF